MCLKIAFGKLCVFDPDEGGVAGYVDRIGGKYTAKWGVQIVGMNFQTGSRLTILLTAAFSLAYFS